MDPNNPNNVPFIDIFGNPVNPNTQFNSPVSQFKSFPNPHFNSPNPHFNVYSYNPYPYMGMPGNSPTNFTQMMQGGSTNAPSSDREPHSPSTEVPLFSTQNSEDEATSPQKQATKTWAVKEDKLLISAWLNCSKDSIQGNQQKAVGFWKKVKNYYDEHRTTDMRDRGHYGVFKSRWFRLSGFVNKFAGIYARLVQRNQSGLCEGDILGQAAEIYKDETGKKFSSMHAWRLLRDETKWLNEVGESSAPKRTKTNAAGAYTSSSNADNSEHDPSSPPSEWQPSGSARRPIGQKEAKRKERAKASASSTPVSIDDFSQYFSTMQGTAERRLEILADLAKAKADTAKAKAEKAKAKAEEVKAKQRELDMEVLRTNTSGMDKDSLEVHKMMVAEIKERLRKM